VAYCPECLTEYAQGSPECIDCRVPLHSGPPPARGPGTNNSEVLADLDLVVVRTFMGLAASFNAEMARNILEAEGIPCALLGEAASRIVPGHDAVRLRVAGKDAARAAEILQSYLDNPAEAPAEPEAND
jgi:hypothetical protein